VTSELVATTVRPSPGGTPYLNSRIRAQRSSLLKASDLENYLHEPDLDSFVEHLKGGSYGPLLGKAQLTQTGIEAVSRALQMMLSQTYFWVYEMSESRYRSLLAALATKWDIQDIKTIIRAKAAGVALSEYDSAFVGVGVSISADNIRALARQQTLEDVVALALTWKLPYRQAFAQGLENYYLNDQIADFELQLDHAYLKWARTKFRGLGSGVRFARSVFGQEIDRLNLATLIRLVETPGDVEEPLSYFLEGGCYLDVKKFTSLMEGKDLFELINSLDIPEYKKALAAGYEGYLLTGHLSEFERALEAQLTRQTIEKGFGDILGFGVALSYLTARENEVTNLNIIAHGLSRHVDPEIIREDLILV